MSDDRKSCQHEYATEVEFSKLELRCAVKLLETKPIFSLEVPHPLQKEWHRIITEDPSEKTLQVLPGLQLVLDYDALLEGAIRDHALFFPDDTT